MAGSNLKNLVFKVTDSDGFMDTSIHHDEKSGSFHTMSIESDSSSVESATRYAIVHGSCKVPTLSLPENEGVFSFRIFHSRYPELHMSLKVVILWIWVILQYVFTMSRRNCRLLITFPLNIHWSLDIQIQLTPAQTFERDEIECSTSDSRMILTPQSKMASTTVPSVTPTQQTPCSQFRVLTIRGSSSAVSSQTGPMDMAQFTEVFISITI